MRHHIVNNDLDKGDLLIHCGDITGRGDVSEVKDFLKWFSSQQYTHKVFIAGNHDLPFQHNPDELRKIVDEYNVHYLEDSSVIIEGLHIYGSPWQPKFNHWAFNLERGSVELKEKWSMIPDDTDILITHGPPQNILDYSLFGRENTGCSQLRYKVEEINPMIHCFGHIHEGYGIHPTQNTMFVNSSMLDQDYKYTHKPVELIH